MVVLMILCNMRCIGMPVDTAYLMAMIEPMKKRCNELENEAYRIAGN